MTDTARRSASTRELPLAPGGEVVVTRTSNDVRSVGPEAPVVTIRTRGGEDIDDELTLDAEADRVIVRNADAGSRGRRVLFGGHGPADLDLEIPRTARITFKTLSGDVVAERIGGDSRWSTASGTLRLRVAGGSLTADSMSGDITIEADEPIGIRARSVSGDLRLRAPHVDALEVSSTSGDIRVTAPLGAGFEHTISSVSGDVHLQSPSPIRLDGQTIAGDSRATGAHVAEGGRGRRTIVVGDGSVRVGVRTTSGDIRLEATHGVGSSRPAVAPIPPVPPVTPPVPPRAPTAPEPPATDLAQPWVVAEAEAAPNLVRADAQGPGVAEGQDASPLPDPALPADAGDGVDAPWSAGDSGVDRREQARLDILRALERGELDVAAASHRLEQLEEAGPRYFRGFC